ncbi:MAG: septal ring lytic transglycosylase RlpA family protein [Candidatus Caenarcaniphilales bacterium]|nr:septal ring lytic transglycosylase RlpA family protein [Candidatus Caenarcaniphilales bacterium]
MKHLVLYSALLIMLFPSLIFAKEFELRAACYGPGLYGRRTANGTKLRRWTRGIAHKHWQFGEKVVLKYKNNRTKAKVIDRGPNIRGLSIDVTEATAKALGFKDCKEFGVRTLTVQRK